MPDDEKKDGLESTRPQVTNWKNRVEEQYRKIKDHAEAYPYVWALYIVVYGGLAVWTTYRWRKLRQTEDRVRLLQERLRKLVEAEQISMGCIDEESKKL